MVIGIITAVSSIMLEMDETDVQVKGNKVIYTFLTTGFPLEAGPRMKTRIFQWASLPAKRLEIKSIVPVERGFFFMRYLITCEGRSAKSFKKIVKKGRFGRRWTRI